MATNSAEKLGDMQQRTTKEILQSINELSRLKHNLRNQLDECSLQRSLLSEDDEYKDVPKEILLEKLEEAKTETLKVKALSRLRDDLSKEWPQASEAYCAMYPNNFPPHAEDESFSAEQRRLIRIKMFQLRDLNKEITLMKQQKMKLKLRSRELDKEIKEQTTKNRESLQILQHKKNVTANAHKTLSVDERKEIEKNAKKLRCIKHIFQSVIQASQIDWNEDEELRQLVFRLGRPESSQRSDSLDD